MVGIKVTFGVRTDIGIVADHGAAVVAAFDLNQCLGGYNMAKLAAFRPLYRIGQVRVVIYNRNARPCFNSLQSKTVHLKFGGDHGSG